MQPEPRRAAGRGCSSTSSICSASGTAPCRPHRQGAGGGRVRGGSCMGGVPHAGSRLRRCGLSCNCPRSRRDRRASRRWCQPDGAPFDASGGRRGGPRFCSNFDRFAPDILLTEAFPFGRSQMRFELLPLLDRAERRPAPPLVATRCGTSCSGTPTRIASPRRWIWSSRYFDLVLVHGDPRLARLEASFPEARCSSRPSWPTPGWSRPIRWADHGSDQYAAVVSVGGGAVGGPLLEAALRADR